MSVNDVQFLLFVLIAVGAYYLALTVRQFHLQSRDPNLSFVTHSHLEKLRGEFIRIMSEATHDLRTLRAEIREDTRLMQRQYGASLSEMRELISKNAQNISSLAAQAALANQRISELTVKTDKLSIKFKD